MAYMSIAKGMKSEALYTKFGGGGGGGVGEEWVP